MAREEDKRRRGRTGADSESICASVTVLAAVTGVTSACAVPSGRSITKALMVLDFGRACGINPT